MTIQYVVELEGDVWLAPWPGDPGRTLVLDNARLFGDAALARNALRAARRYGKFSNGQVLLVDVTVQYTQPPARDQGEAG